MYRCAHKTATLTPIQHTVLCRDYYCQSMLDVETLSWITINASFGEIPTTIWRVLFLIFCIKNIV